MREVTHLSTLLIRVAAAIAGVGMLAAGVVAVFATENGTGSAALVAAGAALLIAAGLWDRLAIEHSRSAFEQYHGLHLAVLMLPTLTEEQKKELQALLTSHKCNAAYITEGTDRFGVARRIRAHLSDV